MTQKNDRPLRVVLLTPYIAPFSIAGGVGELYKTIAEGLGDAGHDVTVIGIDLHELPQSTHSWGRIISLSRGKKIRFVPRPFQDAFAIAREVRRRAKSVDVIECTSWPGLSAFLLGTRLPIVVRLITSIAVDSHVKRKELIIMFLLEWLAVRRATMIFASTDYILRKSRQLYRLALPCVAQVSLAVADVAQPLTPLMPNTVVQFLVIAAATKRKGTDVLLRALSIVTQNNKSFSLTVVGASWAPLEQFAASDPELATAWEAIQSRLGSRLELRYDISDEQKIDLLARTDYLIMTSRSESFGLPVVEAMRSGAAVISSRGGALSEVSGASENNFFYSDPEDSDALARLLLHVIELGPDNAFRRKSSSRLAYERFYKVQVLVEKSTNGYRQAIEMKRGAAKPEATRFER